MNGMYQDMKATVLAELYASVERMNENILSGDQDAAIEEQSLQTLLRREFEELAQLESQGR